MSTKPLAYLHALQASQGARPRQEDYASLWRPETLETDTVTYPLLAVLADGMGGHVSGQVASQLACEAFISSFSQDSGDLGPRMAGALDNANSAIAGKVTAEPDHRGMGCTLIAAYLDEEGLRWVSVGDSALLLLRDGKLHRLNADHSHGALLDKQASEGIISKEAAETDSRRRALRSALTGERIPIQEIHAQVLKLQIGDKLIVASDGLLTLSGDEIANISENTDVKRPDALNNRLITSVNDKKIARQDNTTIVAIGVIESDGRAPVISTPVQSTPAETGSETAAPSSGVPMQSTPRVLGLKLPHFAVIVLLVFLVGFFAV